MKFYEFGAINSYSTARYYTVISQKKLTGHFTDFLHLLHVLKNLVKSELLTFTSGSKPDPAFYKLACQRNGLEPQECIFLDDLGM